MTVRFDGSIGKTLRTFAQRHAAQIDEIEKSGDDCYCMWLRQGWRVGDNFAHAYNGDTVSQLLEFYRSSPPVPCDCEDCK